MLESKRRAAIFLLLAFLLASVAGYLVYEKVKDLNSQLGGMTKIYVAKTDIPARTLIKDSHLTTMEIPNKFYIEDSHIKDKSNFVNTVAIVPVEEGHIITENILKPYSDTRDINSRLVAMYPSEKVQFDQVVAHMDRVDIVVSTEENGKEKTEIFMRDVLVAHADGTDPKDFKGVALEVSLEDAPKLIHIQNYADKVRILKANVGTGESVMTSKPAEQKPVETKKQPADSAGGDQQKNTPADPKQKPAEKTDPNKADTSKKSDGTP